LYCPLNLTLLEFTFPPLNCSS